MDLKGISEKASESKDVLDALRLKKTKAEIEARSVREIMQGVREKEAPLVTYARDLINLSGSKIGASSFYGSVLDSRRPAPPRTSPLVKVGNEGKNKHYFVSARENYVPKDYDGDGNARGETFVGYSFVASIGMKLTQSEYYALPSSERDELTHLGETLTGEQIYGSIVSVETFGDPTIEFETVERANEYRLKADELLTDVSETVGLVRQSLGNQRLNPRGNTSVPPSLL